MTWLRSRSSQGEEQRDCSGRTNRVKAFGGGDTRAIAERESSPFTLLNVSCSSDGANVFVGKCTIPRGWHGGGKARQDPTLGRGPRHCRGEDGSETGQVACACAQDSTESL